MCKLATFSLIQTDVTGLPGSEQVILLTWGESVNSQTGVNDLFKKNLNELQNKYIKLQGFKFIECVVDLHSLFIVM